MLTLPKFSARDARALSAVAKWIAARQLPARVVRVGDVHADPYAASCEVRIAGEVIDVRGSAKDLAQELLGGPAELAAPRPLGAVEHALWALAVARAAEAAGIACEVWPRVEPAPVPAGALGIEVIVAGTGGGARNTPAIADDKTVVLYVRPELLARVPPERFPTWAASWTLDVPIVVGRCALAAGTQLAVRDLVTIEGCLEAEIFGGAVGLRAAPNAVFAEVVSGYVRRDMSLPDDAHVELSVGLGTTKLAVREALGLAVGQIVQLGRPLAGPFEVRVDGRFIGSGELVEVDGELAVRIVSLET